MAKLLAKLVDVSIGYETTLIDEINQEIYSGDVIAVLGPSGIGKTTLLRTLAGLVRPISGIVELKVEHRGGLGYIPQRLGLISNMSVRSNVEMGARMRASRWLPPFFPLPKKLRPVVDNALHNFGLNDFIILSDSALLKPYAVYGLYSSSEFGYTPGLQTNWVEI